MAQICHTDLVNLRCIEALDWQQSSEISCFIGPGDTGNSTIVEAVDLCLGARCRCPIQRRRFSQPRFADLKYGKCI